MRRALNSTVWFLFALGATSCGGMAMAPETDYVEPERENPAELAEELEAESGELDMLLTSTEPNCARACEIGAAICDLQSRICGIAERHPTDRQTAEHCDRATARCTSATDRVGTACSACDEEP